jgi:hypothetical protein
MKIRVGFVSNSSSSSFVAVGISKYDHPKLYNELMNAIGLPIIEGYDEDDIDKLADFYDHGSVITKDGSDIVVYGGYEFWFTGFDAIPLFSNDMKLSEIKIKFHDIVMNKYKIDIPLSDIEFVCSEISSE